MHAALLLTVLASQATSPAHEEEGHWIAERTWHLGNDPTPDWSEAATEPEGTRVDVTFVLERVPEQAVLELRQRSVGPRWSIELNGERVARLKEQNALVTRVYALPTGRLLEGENRLAIVGDDPTDDVTVGRLRWFAHGLREHLDLRPLRVRVRDAADGAPLPARVSVVGAGGARPELWFGERAHTALRPGVCYTADGEASFELPAGAYTVYASRGLEWSLAQASWRPGDGDVELVLERELDTTGFVACDTHVHTYTHSGHGDASMEERQVTLAGEGVELAIATDHNHNTDYAPVQRALALERWYTSVVGNEVTTPIGHMNGFPLDPADAVPPHDLDDIVRIVAGIRERGAQVVVLNHPRWPSHEEGPHGVHALDEHTGAWTGSWAFPFDALELINSDTEERDPMLLFRDWFALLNRGEELVAVGSSDSHAVDVVVGQGRTYVASASDDPADLDLDECFVNLRRGRSSISMGIFADLRRRASGTSASGTVARSTVARSTVMGQTLPVAHLAQLELRVAAPSWGRPRRVTLFANGVAVTEHELAPEPGAPLDERIALDPAAPWPAHDFWLVAVAHGDAVGQGWWPLRNDYTLAATNPVYVDVDGDGVSDRARTLARERLATTGDDPAAVERALAGMDLAVTLQALDLLEARYLEQARSRLQALGRGLLVTHPDLLPWLERRGDAR